MDKGSKYRTFSASIENLHPMLKFIKKQTEKAGLDENLINQVELALEEALVNIIKHGFVGVDPGSIKISCHAIPLNKIEITITDNGIPYNPLLNPKKKDISILESDLAGGYGIFLIIKIMDQVAYEYKNGLNHLNLIKFYS